MWSSGPQSCGDVGGTVLCEQTELVCSLGPKAASEFNPNDHQAAAARSSSGYVWQRLRRAAPSTARPGCTSAPGWGVTSPRDRAHNGGVDRLLRAMPEGKPLRHDHASFLLFFPVRAFLTPADRGPVHEELQKAGARPAEDIALACEREKRRRMRAAPQPASSKLDHRVPKREHAAVRKAAGTSAARCFARSRS